MSKSTPMPNDNLLELMGGLWLCEKKRKFNRGELDAALLVFRSDRKKLDVHPDYRLFVSVRDDKNPIAAIDEGAADVAQAAHGQKNSPL